MKKSIFILTYGCTLNQADSDMMKGILYEKGYEISQSEEDSDLVILNTCTVKGATESRILQKMLELKAREKKVVVAGCLSVNTIKIRKKLSLAPIVWAGAISKIDLAVDAAFRNQTIEFRESLKKEGLPKFFSAPILRLPISEGCLSFCNFCQTKLARPRLRSFSPEGVVHAIVSGLNHGAKEVQMTSMDAGAYGAEIKTNLGYLMEKINRIDTKERFYIRLGMANPDHVQKMKDKIIEELEGKGFYKFLHLPVQSGSEKVCKEMNRDHTVADFIEIVKYAREKIPDITIATDIIVGYPTETEKDFEDTYNMIKDLEPDVVNISKFSIRKGTKAALLQAIDNKEVKRRSTILAKLVRGISQKKNEKLVGKIYEVLITEKQDRKNKDFTGRNINYKQVVVKGFNGNLGDFCTVKVTSSNYGCLIGEIV